LNLSTKARALRANLAWGLPMESYLGPLLFSVQGRINRPQYWITAIVYTSVMIAIIGLGFFFNFNTPFLALTGIILLALIVSGILVGVKRLHDRDKSGVRQSEIHPHARLKTVGSI
jgi:uncharacterized membrane protein YhaH (DUF805 family)